MRMWVQIGVVDRITWRKMEMFSHKAHSACCPVDQGYILHRRIAHWVARYRAVGARRLSSHPEDRAGMFTGSRKKQQEGLSEAQG